MSFWPNRARADSWLIRSFISLVKASENFEYLSVRRIVRRVWGTKSGGGEGGGGDTTDTGERAGHTAFVPAVRCGFYLFGVGEDDLQS